MRRPRSPLLSRWSFGHVGVNMLWIGNLQLDCADPIATPTSMTFTIEHTVKAGFSWMDLVDDGARLAKCRERRTTLPERQTRTENAIEHPCGDDNCGRGVWKSADENFLTAPLFAVMHIDGAAARGVPGIVDLSAKSDMGRMTFDLPLAERTRCLRAAPSTHRTSPSSSQSSRPAGCTR